MAAHIGAMDICARGLKAAAAMLDDGGLEAARNKRYADWNTPESQNMLKGGLEQCYEHTMKNPNSPKPQSGGQERLENLINRFV